jgi:LemA protein
MTTTQITAAAVTAILLFWIVGAYNRMVSLRNALVARFAAVDELFRQRHALIERQVELLAAALASAGPRLEALRAACRQADAAREHASKRPGAAGAVTSLRVAEDILADARARLPVQSVAGADLPELNTRIAASDTTLDFARREFNAAVAGYNEAVRQFPAVLVARLFGFRPAAPF